MSRLREKLARGELAVGQMALEFFTPGIGPMMAACGMDFVLYDMEHGRCDIHTVAEMIASCRGSDIDALVRVPDLEQAPLSRVLDLGAKGVMVPRIETREQMERVVGGLKYAPQGKRGVALGIAHDLYQSQGAPYFEEANREISVIALVETERAFDNIEAIVSTPGLDVAWMGHYDLTVSMGIPAQFDHPRFLSAMDLLVETCARHHVAAGFLPATPDVARQWIARGFRVLSLGSDIGMYMHALRSFRSQIL